VARYAVGNKGLSIILTEHANINSYRQQAWITSAGFTAECKPRKHNKHGLQLQHTRLSGQIKTLAVQSHTDVTFAFYTVLCGTVQNTARGATGGTSRTHGHTARTASQRRLTPTTIVRLAAGSVPRLIRSFSSSLPRMRTSHDTRRFIGYKTHSRLLCILRFLKTFTVTLHKAPKCDFQYTASGSRTENFQVPLTTF